MAVISYREVLPRTFSHRFGEAPTAERRYVVTVDAPESHQTLLNTVGIFHGASHPEYSYLLCVEGSITESDRQHAEITYRYELPRQEPGTFSPNPLARGDIWTFSIGGSQVPALTYYHGSGNGTVRALVNSANDLFEGLTTLECEVRATISSNRPLFPLATAANVTNAVNASPYLGGAAHSWQCAGVSGQPAGEVVNGVEVRYWQISVELVYRKSGWDLLIPDIGLNCISGSNKKPCLVQLDGEDIAASTPQPLNTDGTQKYPPGTTPGLPDLLTRRIYPEVDFASYFGTPPFA